MGITINLDKAKAIYAALQEQINAAQTAEELKALLPQE